jgi:hypothetical protein
LLEAQSLLTAFFAAEDGFEEIYNPCSLPPFSTTVKCRLSIIYINKIIFIYIYYEETLNENFIFHYFTSSSLEKFLGTTLFFS